MIQKQIILPTNLPGLVSNQFKIWWGSSRDSLSHWDPSTSGCNIVATREVRLNKITLSLKPRSAQNVFSKWTEYKTGRAKSQNKIFCVYLLFANPTETFRISGKF